jgi:hypothetical protein
MKESALQCRLYEMLKVKRYACDSFTWYVLAKEKYSFLWDIAEGQMKWDQRNPVTLKNKT